MQGNLYVYFVINIREGHEPSVFQDEMAIGKLKRHKSIGIDQIQAELIIEVVEKFFLISLNLLTLFGIGKKCLRSGMSHYFTIFKKGDKIECSDYRGISFWTITYKHLSIILLSMLTTNAEKFIRDN